MNKLVRVSPSKIEQFRKHYDQAYNGFITKEMVIDNFKGVREWKQALDFGTGYHALIEHGGAKYWDGERCLYAVQEDQMQNPILFTEGEASLGLDYHDRYLGCVPECWWMYRFEALGYTFEVPMRIDMMYGLECHEVKTTSRQVSIDDYMDSFQWRCYQVATGCQFVQYDIFQFKKLRGEVEHTVKEHNFRFYPEHDIEQNVQNMAKLTLEFALDNNIGGTLIRGLK